MVVRHGFVIASRRRTAAALLALSAGSAVGGCSQAGQPGTVEATGTARSASTELPSRHVHGVGRDPGSGVLLLATHEGLFRYGEGGPERVGPVVDLMAFSIAGPGHYYASGHPGAGVDLPQPVGLIESRDGGEIWTVLSRGGQSDFHALAAAADTVIGFDGQLRLTTDGTSWATRPMPAPPRALAADPRGLRVLATTEGGLRLSKDRGQSWAEVAGAPLMLLVAWADQRTAVGVTPTGVVMVSTDSGQSWRASGSVGSAPQALSAGMVDSRLEILVVTDEAVLRSVDGSTFTDATTRR